MESMLGQTLGQYQLVEQIGKGGMATVYKAYQPSLNRHVAVKILPPYFLHEAGFAERFTREAQAIARLDHPNILPVYDFGKQDGISYIVMKYVPAGTLHDQLGSPMSPAQALKIIEQVAGALDNAHEQGILHRDIKPSNVLIDERGWVYLSDFGLAKMVEGSVQLTGSGVGVGTPAYMSPEQGQGMPVDARTDVYAMGVVLFEMLTGHVPYEAETPMAVVIKHITDPIPLPRRMNPNIPEAVEQVLLKALAKNPADRFGGAGEMSAALRRAVERLEPGVAATPIAADPDVTVAHVGPIRPPPPPPVAGSQPATAPLSAAPVADQPGVPWLPILAGGLALVVSGACLVAGLYYFMGGTPASNSPVSQQVTSTDTPLAVVATEAQVTDTPTSAPTLPTATPSPAFSPTHTPQPAAPTDMPVVICTPPPCQANEVYYCPDECPGGCGTGCATVTPGTSGDTITPSPTPTFTSSPTPTPTPSPTTTPSPTVTPLPPPPPRWTDTGLRPGGQYADIWTRLGAGAGELGYPVLNPVGDRLCARQNFERGYMVWFDSPQDPDPVWAAVMPDPAVNSANKSYKFTDTWPGSPEYWCSEAEARAPLGPRRGFGMLWCIYPDLKTDIGQALDQELGGPDYPRCEAQVFQGGAILHNPLDAKFWVFIDTGNWYRFDD